MPRLSHRAFKIREAIIQLELEAQFASELERMQALEAAAEYLGRLTPPGEHHNYLLGVIRHYFNLIGKEK